MIMGMFNENKLKSRVLVHPIQKIVLLVKSNDKVQFPTEEPYKFQDKFVILRRASCMRTKQPHW